MFGIRVEKDTSALTRLIASAPEKIDQVLGKVAFDMVADIMISFSTSSPSAPGTPPGVDTGALKNSIRAERIKVLEWHVIAGTEYAHALEYGFSPHNLAARPFMRPAATRAQQRLPATLGISIRWV